MGNEEYIFSNEKESGEEMEMEKTKILIVDDEKDVHSVTRLALQDFVFDNKRLNILSVYSAEEAMKILREEDDIAVILLDVVMEEEESGLIVANYLRNELNNKLTRIILRTGQPGKILEEKITMDYDINDYKVKTELTAKKLFTTMIVALRNYRDLKKIDDLNKNLEEIVEKRTKDLNKALEKLKNTQREMVANEKMVWIRNLINEIATDINGSHGSTVINMQMIKREIEMANNDNFEHSKKFILENIEVALDGMKKSYRGISKLMEKNIFLNRGSNELEEAINLKELLESSLNMANDIYKNGAESNGVTEYIEIDENLMITGDEIKLMQSFYSIIENAYERLVDKQILDAGKYIKIKGYRSSAFTNEIVVEIEDNGTGLTEDMKSKIYDPFFTTKDQRIEKLIAMTKSYYTIKNSGAKIEVLDNEGGGVRFVIVFKEKQ